MVDCMVAWWHGYMVATNNARLYGCLHATVRAIMPQTVVVRCAATVHAANKRLSLLSRAESEHDADI